MAKEYATVQINAGTVHKVDTGSPSGSADAKQFDGLKNCPLAYALNKLDELGYAPLAGAIDHGQVHPSGAQYTLILARDR